MRNHEVPWIGMNKRVEIELSLEWAIHQGYKPCRNCYGKEPK